MGDIITGKKKDERMSLTDQAYAQLKAEIISGRIVPGSHIDVNALAAQTGVSKTPVREAILRLANEGVVEVNARRGVRVIPLSAADLSAIYELITALEVEAVSQIAARKPDTEILKPLIEQLVRMRTAIEVEDGEAWSQADEAFHRSLLNLCGNPRLAEAGNHYRDIAQRAHFVALRLVSNEQKARSAASHAELIDCLRSGDPAAARHMHRQQRERGGDLLVKSLQKIGVEQF